MNLIYHHYDNLSLLDSATALLKSLNVPLCDLPQDSKAGFAHYGGHFGRIANEEKSHLAAAYNLALANKNAANLITLEEDATCALAAAKAHIEVNPNLFSQIESELSKLALSYNHKTKLIYLSSLIYENLATIKSRQARDMGSFKVALMHSSRCVGDFASDKTLEILQTLGLKVVYEEKNAFFQNEIFNPELSYKYSAKTLENAQDCGCDFIVSASMGVFEAFDKKFAKLKKSINRDLSALPVLFLPQVVLLSLGVKDDVALALRYHRVQFL